MADVDFGLGPNTDSGDFVSQALVKLQDRAAALEVAGPALPNIAISNAMVNENSVAGIEIGTLSTNLPGTWAFTLVADPSNGSAVLSGTNNAKVYTTSKGFDFEALPTVPLTIKADNGQGLSFTDIVTLVIGDIDEDGPTPTYDLDFNRQAYSGATLADVGNPPVEEMGVRHDSAYNVYSVYTRALINRYSAFFAGGPRNDLVVHNPDDDAIAPGFAPVRVNHPGFQFVAFLGGTVNLEVGKPHVFKVRCGYIPGDNETNDLRYDFYNTKGGPSGGQRGFFQIKNPAAGNGAYLYFGETDAVKNFTVLNFQYNSAGNWFEVDLLLNFQATEDSGDPTTGLIADSLVPARSLVYGFQVTQGSSIRPWMDTGAANTLPVLVPGANFELGGPIGALLQTASWTVVIEVNGNGYNMNATGPLLSAGSTPLVKLANYTSVQDNAGTVHARADTMGFLGLGRVAISRSSAGLKMSVNGGPVATAPTPALITQAVKVLDGNGGYIRRVSAWNEGFTNSDDLRVLSSLENRPSVGIGEAAANPRPGPVVFMDDMEENSIRIHGLGINGAPGGYQDQEDKYYSSANTAANTKADGTPKRWIPRYHFNPDPPGMSTAINNELQYYLDPEYVANKIAAGADFGTYRPIRFPMSVPGVDSPSVMRFTMARVNTLPQSARDAIPKTYGPQSNQEWPYVCGVVQSGQFKVAFGKGHKFSWRCRYDVAPGLWGAVWLYGWAHAGAEIDVLEVVKNSWTQNVHDDNFGLNFLNEIKPPVDPGDWHNHEMNFGVDGKLEYSVSGRKTTIYDLSNRPKMMAAQLYLIMNLAMDSGSIFANPPTAETEAKLPAVFDVDFARVVRSA